MRIGAPSGLGKLLENHPSMQGGCGGVRGAESRFLTRKVAESRNIPYAAQLWYQETTFGKEDNVLGDQLLS